MTQNATGGVRVASVKDITEGKSFCAKIGDKALAVFKTESGYAAIDNLCPHVGGPLCEGAFADGVVTCPWHGSQFKVETGEVVHGPAKKGVQTYPVEVRGDSVFVTITPMDPARSSAPSSGKAPKAVTFSFQKKFDAEHPFANEGFVKDLIAAIGFEFKLYGKLNMVPIAQDGDEMDFHLGEVHVTEMDLKKMSEAMTKLNTTYGTTITYCIFQSAQFPGMMLLNIRGPKASMSLENDIKY